MTSEDYETMDYVKMDPRRHTKPKAIRAGWFAMRVLDVFVDIAGHYDLRGEISSDYYEPGFIAQFWNLGSAYKENLITHDVSDIIVDAIKALTDVGYLVKDSASGNLIIVGWQDFYGRTSTSTERMASKRSRDAGTEPAPQNVTNSDECDVPTHPPTRPTHNVVNRFSVAKLMEAWNDFAGRTKDKIPGSSKNLARLYKVSNGKRSILAKARCAEYTEDQIRTALERVATYDCLLGLGSADQWVANFDWFVAPDSIQKLLAGFYDNWERRVKSTKAKAAPESQVYTGDKPLYEEDTKP